MKEKTLLREQIQIAEQLSGLVHGKISKIPRAELASTMHMVEEENITLPFRLRCSILSRRLSDLMDDVKDAQNNKDSERAAQEFCKALCLWAPADDHCNEEKLQANNLWASGLAGLKVQNMRGELSNDQMLAETETAGKDCLDMGGGTEDNGGQVKS